MGEHRAKATQLSRLVSVRKLLYGVCVSFLPWYLSVLLERSLKFCVPALGGGPHTFFHSPPDNVKGAFVDLMGEVSRTNFSMTQPCWGWAQLWRCKKQLSCRASWNLVAELPSNSPGLRLKTAKGVADLTIRSRLSRDLGDVSVGKSSCCVCQLVFMST